MKQRDLVTMSAAEVASLLAGSRKVQLGTLNPDGSVHLVTMFYGLIDGQIAFWTYRTSQKALNLARDPRITCLVEDGTDYFELRGVQIRGTVRVVSEFDDVLAIGRLVAGGMAGSSDAVDAYVAQAARKRLGYIVEPDRIVSWDHSKLLSALRCRSPQNGLLLAGTGGKHGRGRSGGHPTGLHHLVGEREQDGLDLGVRLDGFAAALAA
jgi:PPOX class probable F420-dependent enzyme